MIVDSLYGRNELFFATAAIAAHAQSDASGFRQRDLRFFIELFTNWLEAARQEKMLEVQNTQVSRYLQFLCQEGYAVRLARRQQPRYRLTRVGLIELLGSMVGQNYVSEKDHFFFLYYFLKNYKVRLKKMVEDEGSQFPFALKVELDNRLSVGAMLDREIDAACTELKKLDHRIDASRQSNEIVKRLQKDNVAESDIIKSIQKRFPYGLNSQKPLDELLFALPKEVRLWEIQHGYAQRIEDLFKLSRELLVTYIQTLKGLAEGTKQSR